MRFAVTALLVTCLAGCKDKPAEKKPAPVDQAPVRRAPERPVLETSDVSGTGVVPATNLGPKIVVSKNAIELDGQRVMDIGSDGVINRKRLESLTTQLETKTQSDAPVALLFDATLQYRQIGIVLEALKRAGFRNVALLTGSGSTMIPLDLQDASEVHGAGLRPMVTLQGTHVMLWSASGEEGTRTAPKASFDIGSPPSFAPLTRALAEIVQRRWPDGTREDADRTIILQIDGRTPTQTVLQLAAAVRADGSLMLFPGIFFAGAL
jgi:biopolymer transport protein ExbD